MNYSITKDGEPADTSLYAIDEENRTFSTDEEGLVLDFRMLDDFTIKNLPRGCKLMTRSTCIMNGVIIININ